ncbi:MAG: hypothetical protein IPL84_10185 [Chitinophagaceae bacterium]|nr:hypothetical protein [Chitinophagaceae bacterium]
MKQFKSIIAIVVFSFLSFTQATAGKTADSMTNLPVELKFMGTFKSQYIFELHVNGTTSISDFNISITDANGYTFFDNNVKGQVFTKQFSVNEDVLAESVITFTITEKKTGKKVSYQVDQQEEVSKHMHIVKL